MTIKKTLRRSSLPETVARAAQYQGLVLYGCDGAQFVLPLSPVTCAAASPVSLNNGPADESDSCGLEHTFEKLPNERSATVPESLAEDFRVTVLGLTTGKSRLRDFEGALRVAVEDGIIWNGNTYSPLSEWSAFVRSRAWKRASLAERSRWGVMVADMHKVYNVMREMESNRSAFERRLVRVADPRAVKGVLSGNASWKVMRELASRCKGIETHQQRCRMYAKRARAGS